MFDPREYVSDGEMRDGSPGLEIDSAAAYPASIADLRSLVTKGARVTVSDAWTFLVERDEDQKVAIERAPAFARALNQVLEAAAKLPKDAWDLALKPLADIDAARRADRAGALECARLWFTELLHQTTGGGEMNVRWLKAEQFRQ